MNIRTASVAIDLIASKIPAPNRLRVGIPPAIAARPWRPGAALSSHLLRRTAPPPACPLLASQPLACRVHEVTACGAVEPGSLAARNTGLCRQDGNQIGRAHV